MNALDLYDTLSGFIRDAKIAFEMIEDIQAYELTIRNEEDRKTWCKISLLQRVCKQCIDEISKVLEKYLKESRNTQRWGVCR